VARPEHLVVVVSGRAWSTLRHEVRQDVEVVDAMPVHNHLMLLVRRRGP
jgi:hypothetical protein